MTSELCVSSRCLVQLLVPWPFWESRPGYSCLATDANVKLALNCVLVSTGTADRGLWARVCVCVCACLHKRKNWCIRREVVGSDTHSHTHSYDGQKIHWKRDRGLEAEEEEDMAEVLTLDAILFGILVFSGILGNILVIYTVRAGMRRCHVLIIIIFFRALRIGRYVTLMTVKTEHGARWTGCQYFIHCNKWVAVSVGFLYLDVPDEKVSKNSSDTGTQHQTGAFPVFEIETVLFRTWHRALMGPARVLWLPRKWRMRTSVCQKSQKQAFSRSLSVELFRKERAQC